MGPGSLRDGLPPAVHLAGKAGAALVHATLVVTAVGLLAALAGGVDLTIGRWLGLSALLVSGVLIFSSLGFAIAFLARPRTVTTLINVIFLPLSFASGFFGQLGYRMVMPDASVAAFTGRRCRRSGCTRCGWPVAQWPSPHWR